MRQVAGLGRSEATSPLHQASVMFMALLMRGHHAGLKRRRHWCYQITNLGCDELGIRRACALPHQHRDPGLVFKHVLQFCRVGLSEAIVVRTRGCRSIHRAPERFMHRSKFVNVGSVEVLILISAGIDRSTTLNVNRAATAGAVAPSTVIARQQ